MFNSLKFFISIYFVSFTIVFIIAVLAVCLISVIVLATVLKKNSINRQTPNIKSLFKKHQKSMENAYIQYNEFNN